MEDLGIDSILVCMFVSIEVAFVELPMESGDPTGPGGGTHRDRGSNVLTPRVPLVPRHASGYVLTHNCVFSIPTLL